MNINKNNYEVFFIDYYDGNLSAAQVAELFLFLESYPDLRDEFENFEKIQLDPPEIEFPDRNTLKRGIISSENINHHLVASLEGDLSYEDNKLLQDFLEKNPKYNHDVDLFKKTISTPDFSIVYPDKKSLKKPVPIYVAYQNEIRFGIAAILLISFIAGTISVFNRTMEKTSVQVAQQTTVTDSVNESVAGSLPHLENTNVSTTVLTNSTGLKTANLSAQEQDQTPDSPSKTIRLNQPASLTMDMLEETVQFAAAVPVKHLETETAMQIALQPVSNHDPVEAPTTSPTEKYMTVWEAIRESSEKNLRKAIGKDEEVLAYADEGNQNRLRLADVVSRGVEKISNDKAKLESAYDSDKQTNTFSFSLGNFKVEKK